MINEPGFADRCQNLTERFIDEWYAAVQREGIWGVSIDEIESDALHVIQNEEPHIVAGLAVVYGGLTSVIHNIPYYGAPMSGSPLPEMPTPIIAYGVEEFGDIYDLTLEGLHRGYDPYAAAVLL